jgi:hypothetical protein
LECLFKHVFTSLNDYPIVTQEIALNSSTIMILKIWMSSQTNFFKFPNDLCHFQNVTSNLLHFWTLELTSLDAMIFFRRFVIFETEYLLLPSSHFKINNMQQVLEYLTSFFFAINWHFKNLKTTFLILSPNHISCLFRIYITNPKLFIFFLSQEQNSTTNKNQPCTPHIRIW